MAVPSEQGVILILYIMEYAADTLVPMNCKCLLQVSMHAKMRQEAEILLSALQQAQVHPEDRAYELAVPV